VATYQTAVTGTTITAAWGNNVRDGLVTTFASSAARTSAVPSPATGFPTYRSDVKQAEIFDGTSYAPLQQEFIGNVTRTANSSAITTTETVVDSVTFTAVAGRRYRVTWMTSVQGSAASNNIELRLRYAAGASVTSSGTLIGGAFHTTSASGLNIPVCLSRTVTGIAAGQTTIGALMIVTLGAGSATSVAGANYATELCVEDIGV
jgi:hypothetical protein